MAEITYLERKETDPFHSVMGMVDNISNFMASPFVSTTDSKKPVEMKNNGGKDIESVDDARDDAPFRPSIVAGDSGEDLAFDATKVYTPRHSNDDDERDDVLSVTSSTDQTEQVYNGMSRKYQKALKEADEPQVNSKKRWTRKSKTISTVGSAYGKNLKPTVTSENSAISSRWQKETYEADLAKALERKRDASPLDSSATNPYEKAKRSLSPMKYSVSKINAARSKPVPKSDDFFAELKQWHKDYALREVEKPEEIRVITTKKAETPVSPKQFWTSQERKPDPTEDVPETQEEEVVEEVETKEKETRKMKMKRKKETKKALTDAKKAEKDQRLKMKQMKKEAKRIAAEAKKNKKKNKSNTNANEDLRVIYESMQTEAERKKETQKAIADAKKAEKEQKLLMKEMQKEARQNAADAKRKKKEEKKNKTKEVFPVIECMNDDGSVTDMSIEYSKKKKKLFGRKQKSASVTSSRSANSDESMKLVPLEYPTLGISESPKKVPMKNPETNFVDMLRKFKILQSEHPEEQNSTEISEVVVQEDIATEQTREPPAENEIVVETVEESEEESSIVDNTVEPIETAQKFNEPIGEASMAHVLAELKLKTKSTSSDKVPDLEKKDSWLEKATGFFKKSDKTNLSSDDTVDTPAMSMEIDEDKKSTEEIMQQDLSKSADDTKVSTGSEVTEHNQSMESSFEAVTEDETKETEAELMAETKPSQSETVEEPNDKDWWLDKVAGFFKKEDKAIPPVVVMEVDRDKYEALAENEEKADESGNRKVEFGAAETAICDPVILPEDSVDNMTVEDRREILEESFLEANCPCLAGEHQSKSQASNDAEEIESKPAEKPQQKEVSWFEMATGLFVTKAPEEAPAQEIEKKDEVEEESSKSDPGGATPNASNLEPVEEKTEELKESEQEPKDSDTTEVLETSKSETSVAKSQEETRSETFDDSLCKSKEGSQSGTFDESLRKSQEEGQSGTFDDSILTKEEQGQSGTFDDKEEEKQSSTFEYEDRLLSQEEGTMLTKIDPGPMESLLDLKKHRSSQSMGASGSRSCADSLTEPAANAKADAPSATPSLSRDGLSQGESPQAESGSCIDSAKSEEKSKTTTISSYSSKRSVKPIDMIFLRKKSKNADKEDAENSSASANKKVKEQPKRGKASVAKSNKKKRTKSSAKSNVGATLFGRLEAIPETKKDKAYRKKKEKFSQTLF